MNHLTYYGLSEEPFSIMPLTQFYYHNEQHDQAELRLDRVLQGMKGLGLLVGDVGTGKSLLARRLLESLPEDEYEVSLLVVLHSDVDSDWLIRRIAAQFGVESQPNEKKVDLIGKLYKRLEEIASQGKKAAILIDEAHMLNKREVLEEIRGLLNFDFHDQKLISFLLFGLPELDEVIKLDPPLAHRVTVRCELKPFTRELMNDYIRFRTHHAGSKQTLFAADAIEKIFSLSKGNARLVNVICDNALFEGFVRKSPLPLPVEIIASVGQDLRLG